MLAHAWIATVALVFAPNQAAVVRSTFEDAECLLSGRVQLADGKSVAGARVVLRARVPGESRLLAQGAASHDGRFTLRVEQLLRGDDYMRDSFLEVEAPGLAPSLIDRVYLPPPNLDLGPIVLSPTVELRGRVTASDGTPIAGAQIHAALGRARSPYGDHARRPPLAVTDAGGVFQCRSLPPGLVTLGAGAPGFADTVLDPRKLEPGVPNTQEILLLPERRVRIAVVSKNGGQPLPATCEPIGELFDRRPRGDEGEGYLAFWRGPIASDARGAISLDGLDPSFAGHVLVCAKDHRPELVPLTLDVVQVALQPVHWIELTAVRADGQPVPEIYGVDIRDGTSPPSWCGNCEDFHRIELWKDSRAVESLASNKWRIAWNSSDCYVDGGRPQSVMITLTDGSREHIDLPETESGAKCEGTASFEPPARLSGVVRTADGKPVSMRLGMQLSMRRDDMLSVVSDAEGKFRFDALGDGPEWLNSMDDGWELLDGSHQVELVAGRSTEGVVVVAQPQDAGGSGRARGRVHIDGKPPGKPILLALDEVEYQHLPDAYPRGFAWTDGEGNFELTAPWPREYHIVPKHEQSSAVGGWRDFASEFPAHGERWPWKVDVPKSGATKAEIDFPPEARWDRVAPPEDD